LSRCTAQRVQAVFSTTAYYSDFYRTWFLRKNPLIAARYRFFITENIVFTANHDYPARDEILLKYGVRHDSYFLTLGRLDCDGILQKGFQDLVAALYWLHALNRSLPRDFKLVMIGEGSHRKTIARQVRELGVEEWISIVPFAENEDVRLLQACSAAVVLLSRFDGLSMFALESLASGSPLILSTCGGLQGLVEPGKNGYVVQPQNVPEIAEALSALASLSPEQREGMRHCSRALYEARFIPSAIIKKFLTALHICFHEMDSAPPRSSGSERNGSVPLSIGSR
jgi:glycosyltransferase involved in cell wall biosynthesis